MMGQEELGLFLQLLTDAGVQFWHNRGRLFYGPKGSLNDSEARTLAEHAGDVVQLLRRRPPAKLLPADLVAPCRPFRGGYAGCMVRRPWAYELAVVLPTFGPLDLLRASIACWRNQTVSPYLIVVQSGGSPAESAELEQLRDVDCEIHYLATHGWRHSSAPVAAALDLAFAVIQCNAALLTHVDVFPRHDRVIEELLPRLSASCPVVGYQMSKRIGSDEWARCVSHTLTLVDMVAMRRTRQTWSMLACLEQDDEVEKRFLGWPDTETWFGRGLRAAGIVPEFLGGESNASVYATDLIVHWRSAPSVRHYRPDQRELRHAGLSDWLARTEQLGRAAELPELVTAQAAGEESVKPLD